MERDIFADPEGTVRELASLGADRLAAELLRLARKSDEALAAVIRLLSSPEGNLERFVKKLSRVKRGRKFYDWDAAAGLADELEEMLEDLRAADPPPRKALELLAEFFRSDGRILERCDDSGGFVSSVFSGPAVELFSEFARRLEDKAWVADLVFSLCIDDEYGTRDGLLYAVRDYLPEAEIRALATRLWDLAQEDPSRSFHALWAVEILARELNDPRLFERAVLRRADRPHPRVFLSVAEAYLEADEPEEALEWAERASRGLDPWLQVERDKLLYRIYERLGRREELVEVAWRIFRGHRSVDNLERLLRAVGEEERERIVAAEVEGILRAETLSYSDVSFLVELGRLAEAEEVLLRHADSLDGDRYNTLLPWARALEEGGHPLGATVVYRALLESILARGQSKYYHHGARYLRKLDSLAEAIADWRGLIPHEEYKAALREKHKRKYGFWGKYEGKKGG